MNIDYPTIDVDRIHILNKIFIKLSVLEEKINFMEEKINNNQKKVDILHNLFNQHKNILQYLSSLEEIID